MYAATKGHCPKIPKLMSKKAHISEELFNTIEGYLTNQLSDEARDAFVKQLETDASLNATVEEYRILFQGIETQALKEQMEVYHKEIKTSGKGVSLKPKNNFFKSFKQLAAAASIVIFLGFGAYWMFYGSSKNALYNEYFSPDPGLPTLMGNSDNYNFNEAMVHYKHKDYEVALNKWETLLKNKPNNDTLNYFIGVTKMVLKNTEAAAQNLSKVTAQPSVFKNEAHYFLGLAHLKNKQVSQAVEQLEQSNLPKAKTLLEALKN